MDATKVAGVPGRLRLQAYGMGVGRQLLARGRLGRGLRYLGVPVNYWRALEFQLALGEGRFESGHRVLDVGSPKLLALYLAERARCQVVATDLYGYFCNEYALLARLRALQGRLSLAVADGRRLPFRDASFDRVCSISVLEHIPGAGDGDCIAEIGRVLRPGGRCVVTVPFWPAGRVDRRQPDFYWAEGPQDDGKVFFQRRYNEAQLRQRLIARSGLRLARLRFVGERVLTRSEHEFCEFLPPLTGPFQPALSRLLHTAACDDWRRLRKPLCALLVLERPP
jgi:SAM-dependent methyltransferase